MVAFVDEKEDQEVLVLLWKKRIVTLHQVNRKEGEDVEEVEKINPVPLA